MHSFVPLKLTTVPNSKLWKNAFKLKTPKIQSLLNYAKPPTVSLYQTTPNLKQSATTEGHQTSNNHSMTLHISLELWTWGARWDTHSHTLSKFSGDVSVTFEHFIKSALLFCFWVVHCCFADWDQLLVGIWESSQPQTKRTDYSSDFLLPWGSHPGTTPSMTSRDLPNKQGTLRNKPGSSLTQHLPRWALASSQAAAI